MLKIFRSAVVVMPGTAAKFAKELQGALLPMLNRPSFNTAVSRRVDISVSRSSTDVRWLQTLQEIVSCFCAVVRGQTHDYATMIKVFRASAGEFRLDGSRETTLTLDPKGGFMVRFTSFLTLQPHRVSTCAPSQCCATSRLSCASMAHLTSSAPSSQASP